MSFFWSAEKLAEIGFPLGRDPGVMLMLRCYFDDSGTHGESRVVVWGGLVGMAEDFKALDGRWRALLREPLPGKKPIKQFHLVDCVWHNDEFEGYNQAERDHVRFLFREAIVASPVMPLACAVDVEAWDRIVTGDLRQRIGLAENCAFGVCAREALRIEEVNGGGMALYFDQGRESNALLQVQAGARALVPEGAMTSNFNFSDVCSTPGLQAADTVAYEFYGYAVKWLDDSNTEPNPHLRHFLERSANSAFGVMDEAKISDLAQKMRLDLGL